MKNKKSPGGKKRPMLWIGLAFFVFLAAAIGWATQFLSSRPIPTPPPEIVRVKVPPMPPPKPRKNPEIISDQYELTRKPDAVELKTGENIPLDHSKPDQVTSERAELGQNLQDKVPGVENVTQKASVLAETIAPQAVISTEPKEPVAIQKSNTMTSGLDGDRSQVMSTPEQVEPVNVEPKLDQSKESVEVGNLVPKEAPPSGMVVLQPDVAPGSEEADKTPETEVENQLTAQPDQQEVIPVAPPNTVPPEPKSDTKAPFSLQVGAYLTKEYADDQMAELRKRGYDSFIFETTDKKQRTWYTVRFGHFESREKAAQSLSKFKEKEKMTAIIALSGSL